MGNTYLFTSLAAVVVGGTSLIGARGDYWRTVLGALILTLITTVLVGHGASQAVEEAVKAKFATSGQDCGCTVIMPARRSSGRWVLRQPPPHRRSAIRRPLRRS